MTIPLLTVLPSAPNPASDTPANFSTKAVAMVDAQINMVAELNDQVIPGINDVSDQLNLWTMGAAFALPYTFSTTTTDADPGSGVVRLSSSTQNASTVIRLDLVSSDGETRTNEIDSWDDSTSSTKGTILMFKQSDTSKWLTFSLTSIASPSGYRNLTVSILSSSETSPFANGETVCLRFMAKGDKGDTGSGGVADMLRLDRTSNTILGTSDKGKLLNITSGTFTQTFSACTTLGNGWWIAFRNAGTGRVTFDPNLSETINGATTLVIEPGQSGILQCDGTLMIASISAYTGDDVVTVHTGNGHGSTNTKIRRFTTAMTSSGSAITYADSASAGASFTINVTGFYEIHYSDRLASGAYDAGVSLNSAELTTSVGSITIASRLAISRAPTGGHSSPVTRIVRLSSGDVIRPHTDGNPSDTTNVVFFSIRRIG